SDLSALRPSEPDEHTLLTLVREGATIGAGCRIGPGLTIGRFAMIGMGSVVTRSVPDFFLVLGTPARPVGCVCRCGEPTLHFGEGMAPLRAEMACPTCGLGYTIDRGGEVIELPPPRERTP